MALFTEDTRFIVFMDATAAEPTQQLNGRESLAPVFDNPAEPAAHTQSLAESWRGGVTHLVTF